MASFFNEDSMDQYLASMPINDIPDLFEDDGMDGAMAKMDIPDRFDDDDMDYHLARIPDSDLEPPAKRFKAYNIDGAGGLDDEEEVDEPDENGLIFSTRFDHRFKPVISRDLEAIEDTYVYELKHNLSEHLMQIKDKDATWFAKVGPTIDEAFYNMVKPHLEKIGEHDYLSIQVAKLEDLTYDIYINFSFKNNFKKTSFLEKVSRITQSEKSVFLTPGKLAIKITHFKGIKGNGRGRGAISTRAPITENQYFYNKKSMITIKNNDHTCGYLAITIAKILADHKDMPSKRKSYWDSLLRPSSHPLKMAMIELFNQIDIDTSAPLDETKLRKIQQILPDYQIILVHRPTMERKSIAPILNGEYKNKAIILEFLNDQEFPEGHYNVIKPDHLTGYYDFKFWCRKCWIGYHHAQDHRCPNQCRRCGIDHETETGTPTLTCESCHRDFFGQLCFDNHKPNCEKITKCPKCETEYKKDERFKAKHQCDVMECPHCHANFTTSPHFCFITGLDLAKLQTEDSKNKITVAFDIETRITGLEDGDSAPQPNLLICHTICDRCFNHETGKKQIENCNICGTLEKIFFGDDCVKLFLDYLTLDLAKKAEKPIDDLEASTSTGNRRIKKQDKKSVIHVYAHNLKGFDGRFILQELWNRKLKDMSHVFAGSKILKIDVGLIRFIDSVSFLQMPLSKVAKAFNLPDQKGDFPHHFNKPEFYDYNGPFPGKDAYAIEFMPTSKRNELIAWLKTKHDSNAIFNFKQEFISYCRNDVKILLAAIMQFRQLFKSVAKLDPTTRNFTLAAVGQETYRSNPQVKPIGIVPTTGYHTTGKSSTDELLWLDWIQHTQQKKILRQQRRGNYYADGVDEETGTIYEFNGCFYHGCLQCFPDNRDEIIYHRGDNNHITHNSQYQRYLQKKDYYARRNFQLIEIWEHEFRQLMINTPDPYFTTRRQQLEKIKSLPPALIRSSLFGGRTNNFKFEYDTAEHPDEKIIYVDFTSLYPYVLKNREYPSGHPQVITENFKPVSDYFGFITCRIQPPTNLRIPCLPVRSNNKLLFPLCSACSSLQNNRFCNHTPQERTIEGTWTTAEISEALKQGYLIEEIILVHDYSHNRNTDNEQINIFADYINMWLRIKQEASGYPDWAKNEEDRDRYIRQYMEKEGVALDKAKITKNPGLRQIAKLMLNSFWGKLAQRPNLPKTEIITSHKRLMDIICDEKLKITGDRLINEKTCIISYEHINDEDSRAGNTSPAIASFVTSYARLCLYQLMMKIESEREGRLLYCDTDSAVFVHREGDKEIETGDFLGELTDEFAGDYPGFTCTKGFFCGPKSYMLVLQKQDGDNTITKTHARFKGLTLSNATDSKITPTNIENLIKSYTASPLNPNQPTLECRQHGFTAKKLDQTLKYRQFNKIFRVTSDKRIIIGNDTMPYGWVEK